ncbi:unnamed protein product, partial [Cyprideis torosa]
MTNSKNERTPLLEGSASVRIQNSSSSSHGTSTSVNRRRSMDDEDSKQSELRADLSKQFNMFCNPLHPCHRFLALFLMSFMGFGSYFCFDNPGALQTHIKSDMDVSTPQFASLYSWYSWPNVVLCFIGGFLLDSVFGIRLGTMIFAGIVVLGQLVFAAGAFFNMFWLMEVGRFVFGIGGESLAVAQNTYAVAWFKGKELNMVFGLQLSFARVGSTVNFNVMGPLYNAVHESYKGHTCLGIVLGIASLSCIVSFLCASILGWMDWRRGRILKTDAAQTGETIRLSDVKEFGTSFWLMTVIAVAYYVAIFPFVGLGQVFFQRKFNMTPNAANGVNGIIYVISAVVSPLFGMLIDKSGRNIFWVFLSILVSMGCHFTLAYTFWNPYIAMITLGFAYSLLASALWPMVALVLPEYQLGTAYGIMQAVQNLGLATMTIAAGAIVDSSGYLVLELFFLSWMTVALVAIIALWVVDLFDGGFLNLGVKERKLKEMEIKAMHREIGQRRSRVINTGRAGLLVTPSDTQAIIVPPRDFAIRNRFLSRIGAEVRG